MAPLIFSSSRVDFILKPTLDEEKIKGAISEADKKLINDKCDETIKWLDANQMAEKDEFEDKQKDLEKIFNPIISKLYSGAGGAPGGMPEGGMPGAGGMPGGGA